ncbi:unnamed protein product [Rotaria socialis]|uniref:Helicase ATP-binding domain-containing protein n=1 Tax=Rotaria socialis TaxID=392032 RepID=A0A820EJX8_9BILA|nr:unnamed protein product [Rotaria socialis]CAF4249871.1 unnamed protein product [Rotaria socialis]
MNSVVYLIETAKCSVNAQNEQHLEKILSSSKKNLDYESKTKAASTALHGACFNGHLIIVKYLVENGANYFIKNQALETPFMNIGSHEDMKQYFRNYLLLGYSKTMSGLPDKAVSDEPIQIVDCVWEYKPFNDPQWYSFSSEESDVLQKSLIIEPDQQFKHEIRLTVRKGIYNVSMVQFLRSGKNICENNLAWVRCRGSSILNFDCYSLWQIMFLKHPQAKSNSVSSLKIFNIPTVDDSTFEIELHSWYNCDANTNERFDFAMNYRQKVVALSLDFISDKSLTFNLQAFSFSNNKETITGFIRWIPKLISNNEEDRSKLKTIDNFSAMTNLNPIPLTKKYLQQIATATDINLTKDDELLEDRNGDDATSLGFSNDLDDDDDTSLTNSDEITKLSDSDVWIKNDDNSTAITVRSHDGSEEEQNSMDSSGTVDDDCDETTNLIIDDYLDVDGDTSLSSLSTRVVDNSDLIESHEIAKAMLDTLKKQMEDVQVARDDERQKAIIQLNSAEKKTTELEDKLAETIQRTEHLNAELERLKKKEEKTKEIANNVQTIKYTKIEKHIFYDFLVTKQGLILDYLQRTKKLDDFFIDKIPKLIFEEKRNTYILTLIGIRVHHQAFKQILLRILNLSNIKQRTIDFYQRHLNRITKSINKKLFEVQPNTNYWKQYIIQSKLKKYFIGKIKRIFQEDPKYSGCELTNLCRIPHLLQRLMIYYFCFIIQLPLYESSKELLQQIDMNTVITISTSTGSGKSTLLPALLIAEGYDRAIVTQPRRLPCSLISSRVNKTMTAEASPNGEKLAGWVVSGDEYNPRAKILYLTDGLLKERLLNDERFITDNTSVNKSIVIFIDDVHERSVNIDLCLALIARMLTNNKLLSNKIKVIISSATLHPSVPKLFQGIKHLKLTEFTIPSMGTLYPVKQFKRPNANILNIVQELYNKRRRQDQILCFVNSASKVNQCCRLLAEISQNTIVAYPLVQSQSSVTQQEYLEKGSVFFQQQWLKLL